MTAGALGGTGSILAVAVPLVLALAMIVRPLGQLAIRLAPWASLPALVLAGSATTAEVTWDGILLGMRLGIEGPVTRPFLLLTAVVWLAAGMFARAYLDDDPRRARFWRFFLVTSSANLGLVLAGDVASFYLFYVVMTFAAYGLILHPRTAEARRAGRVYLVMALVGEMLLLTAFLLLVGPRLNLPLAEVPGVVADAVHRDLIVGLVLAGFGVKAGALGLHLWLPLAHPVAPTPASAILSGALIKAGLLGWLRFLPLGVAALPTAGLVCVVAGLGAALYAVAIGLTQRDAKTVLAYSSVSQMGFMTATLGVALAAPDLAAVAVAAVVLYAAHHALAKTALFLGTGVLGATGPGWPRRLVLLGLLLPALDLAGAPLSSGALAKLAIKDVLAAGPWGSLPVGALLAAGAVGTTVLMGHFLSVVASREPAAAPPRVGLWLPWVALLVVDVTLLVRPGGGELAPLVRLGQVWSALWPVVVGVGLLGIAQLRPVRGLGRGVQVPSGDVLVGVIAAAHLVRRGWVAITPVIGGIAARIRAAGIRTRLEPAVQGARRALDAAERALLELGTIGLLFVGLATLGVVLAWIL